MRPHRMLASTCSLQEQALAKLRAEFERRGLL